MVIRLYDPRGTISGWFATRRLRRRFRTTPRVAVRDLPEDTPGKLVGTVHPFEGTTLVAPWSARPCVYYAIEILENRGSGHPASILASEHRGVPFVLAEAGAHAVVDPRDAQIAIAIDQTTTSKAAFDADPVQREALHRHGLVERDWFMTERLEYREAAIELGAVLAVVGSGTREPDPDAPPVAAYRTAGATRLRLTSSARHPLAITDDPRCM